MVSYLIGTGVSPPECSTDQHPAPTLRMNGALSPPTYTSSWHAQEQLKLTKPSVYKGPEVQHA